MFTDVLYWGSTRCNYPKRRFWTSDCFCNYHFYSLSFYNYFRKKNCTGRNNRRILGAWGSSIILTPLAIVLTYQATNDKKIGLDKFTEPIQRFFAKIFKSKEKNTIPNV